jgi:FdrA protein
MTTVTRVRVRSHTYADSVALLQVTAALGRRTGVDEAAVVMATDLNREMLRDSGLLVDDAASAGANDLVIAVRAASEEEAAAALADAESRLAQGGRSASSAAAEELPRSIRSAQRRLGGAANLAIVSVPGPYAAGEARQALLGGMHVLIFSDNVSLDEEVALKRLGRERGLLVMGPDCGTATLGGVGLGFSNAVRRGGIGIVGASGSGMQEVSVLLHRAGQGVSHAIGTGGRDLHEAVGGITTLQALELLDADPGTHTIVLISKPSAPAVAQRVLEAAAGLDKPVVACLLGSDEPSAGTVRQAKSLFEAMRLAVESRGGIAPGYGVIRFEAPAFRAEQQEVRGLYCGGTLADEASIVLRGVGAEHRVIDFGDDAYTRGRAHPMIDPTLRNRAILDAASDPSVAVILLDVILGFGAHPDPAGELVPVMREAQDRADEAGRALVMLAHVVGTDEDPQSLARQEATLRGIGATLLGSNYAAAVAAARLVKQGA